MFSQPLLRLFYGESFVDGWPVLLAYLPSVVLLSLSRILTADLSGRGEITTVMHISLLATVFGLVILPAGIAIWGTMGAALAASVTALLNTSLRVRAYHRITGTPASSLIAPQRDDVSVFLRAARQRLTV
jgi:O-antigen/teichoic acid export membrane protein